MKEAIIGALAADPNQEEFRANRIEYFADAGMTLEIFEKEIGVYL